MPRLRYYKCCGKAPNIGATLIRKDININLYTIQCSVCGAGGRFSRDLGRVLGDWNKIFKKEKLSERK